MWCERMRQQWQHTSSIIAYLVEVNKAKGGSRAKPDDFNPMESGGRISQRGIPLNTQEGFAALQQLAKFKPRTG